jgi:hypothetical protein
MKSNQIIKNHVRFKGQFKKEFKDEFPGRDLAEFITERLRQENCVVNSVEYTEPWFTVNVVSGSIEYPLMVSHSAMEGDYWEISCPRTLGFFARLRGKSEDAELQSVVNALDEILQDEETITDIKWYGDYSDLSDDYVQEPVAKGLSIIGKYLEKLVLPLCLTGCILALIGGIRSGKESILLRIGTIMFLLPIVVWFGLMVINFSWALIDDIKESYRKGLKKKWLRWFFVLAIIAMLVGPFFLGYFDIIPDRMESSIQKFFWAVMVLLVLSGMLFGLFCGATSDIQKQFKWRKKILLSIGITLILLWIIGFFGGLLSSLGVLKWIPDSIEFPLAHIGDIDVNRNGELFVLSRFYGRIQVYDQKGDFMRGWFYYAPSGEVSMKITDSNEIEVAAFGSDEIFLFNENGKLLKASKYEEIDSWYSSEDNTKHLFNESTGLKYDVEGLVFPKIIQTGPDGKMKIGKNAFYLFPFQGPMQAFALGFIGMFIVNKVEKKKKKRRT